MTVVVTPEEAATILQGDKAIALDLETTGFSPWQSNIAVITLYGNVSQRPLILHYPHGRRVRRDTLRWLEGFDEITTHNGTLFDILFLANVGMDWRKPRWYDTMVGELAVMKQGRRDRRVNLQDTAKRRLGKELDKAIDHSGWGNPTLNQQQIDYCIGDISLLLDLRQSQEDRASADEHMLRCLRFEQQLAMEVIQIELNGIPISIPALEDYVKINEARAHTYSQVITAAFGREVNCGSYRQLQTALDEKFGPGVFKDTTKETLADMKYVGGGDEMSDLCDAILFVKQGTRRSGMYDSAWQREYVINHDGFGDTRVHGRFWQIGTNTGRFSCSQPNLQQIPRDMRSVFQVTREDLAFGATDYSGIEVRVAAALAPDEAMIEAFRAGKDIHRFVGSIAFGIPEGQVTSAQRKFAKAMSFTLLFGGGAKTFVEYAKHQGSHIGIDDGDKLVAAFFNEFRGIASMIERANTLCKTRTSATIRYPTGLVRQLVGAELRPTVLLNNRVQGTAAAGLKLALRLMYKRDVIKYVRGVIHDEVIYVCSIDDIERVRDIIEQCMIDGMGQALEAYPPLPIGVESKWGISWEGDPATTHVREAMVNV